MMKISFWKTGALIATASAGMGCWYFAGCPMSVNAEAFGVHVGPTRGPEETVSGRVKEHLKNDHDDVDGLLLEDGKEIHFPPHLAGSVIKLAGVGDDIKVTGNRETRPRGEVVFEASLIEKGQDKLTLERPRPPRGHQEREEAMNATGVVQKFATNPHGDVDGLLLADGTEVKMPPHQGRNLQGLLKEGDKVQIEGRRHVTPHGDVHLHADRITAVESGKSIERDGPGAHRPRPSVEPAVTGPTAKQFEEILIELREVRKLLEAQQKKS